MVRGFNFYVKIFLDDFMVFLFFVFVGLRVGEIGK